MFVGDSNPAQEASDVGRLFIGVGIKDKGSKRIGGYKSRTNTSKPDSGSLMPGNACSVICKRERAPPPMCRRLNQAADACALETTIPTTSVTNARSGH